MSRYNKIQGVFSDDELWLIQEALYRLKIEDLDEEIVDATTKTKLDNLITVLYHGE